MRFKFPAARLARLWFEIPIGVLVLSLVYLAALHTQDSWDPAQARDSIGLLGGLALLKSNFPDDSSTSNITSRGDTLPNVDVLWASAVSKGCQLVNDMNKVESSLSSSEWAKYTSYSDFSTYGWISSNDPWSASESYATAVQALGVSTDASNNRLVEWKHTVSKRINGVSYPATFAQYDNLFNPAGGLIVALINYGPAFRVSQSKDPDTTQDPIAIPPGSLPPLKQWSDVVFLEWQATTTPQQRQNLRWVFRSGIKNLDTKRIILKAFSSIRQVPSDWPGNDFEMDTSIGKALLGTPNGNGMGWLLIQHKGQMGHKVIEKVRVYEHGADGTQAPALWSFSPTLVFYIVDYAG